MNLEVTSLVCDAGIATVTLSRPPVNAVNTRMREELIEIFDTLSDREDVRCVVLTGQGNVFCAGADLKERPQIGPGHEGATWKHNRLVRECINGIEDCRKPVISAVNGGAMGIGVALMTACDIWVASNNAYMALTEIDVGLSGGTALLQSIFGKSRARLMGLTGRRISADELYRLGLIEASLPSEELMPFAMGIAAEIAAKPPLAVEQLKQSARLTALLPPRDGYRYEQNVTAALSRTEDALEARLAFVEKRPPKFKGR